MISWQLHFNMNRSCRTSRTVNASALQWLMNYCQEHLDYFQERCFFPLKKLYCFLPKNPLLQYKDKKIFALNQEFISPNDFLLLIFNPNYCNSKVPNQSSNFHCIKIPVYSISFSIPNVENRKKLIFEHKFINFIVGNKL